jgi:hypothetical protein
MAYNPHMYESVYGFSLFDEFHNFFPELLYDDALFGSETMTWMRHRVHNLFPHVYVRQQNMYMMYSANERMNAYARWHHDNFDTFSTGRDFLRPPPAPRQGVAPFVGPPVVPGRGAGAYFFTPSAPAPPPASASASVSAPPTVADISGAAPTLLPPRSRRAQNTIPTLFTSLIYDVQEPVFTDLTTAANILNLFNLNSFTDVTVAPTDAQIQAASIIRPHNEISEDATCPICMEHESANGELNWRELRCGHNFHKLCIDTWLTSHVQCAICRADVRTMGRNNQT